MDDFQDDGGLHVQIKNFHKHFFDNATCHPESMIGFQNQGHLSELHDCQNYSDF